MLRPSAAAACIAFAALASAAPAPGIITDLVDGVEQIVQDVGFTVEQIAAEVPVLRTVTEIYQSAFAKYGIDTPSPVRIALQSGSVKNTPTAFDGQYLCPVSIGTPAQKLNLNFDTGSADLWVFSTLLPAASQVNHSVYNNASSSSSRFRAGSTWDITYQDQSGSKGVVFGDKVVIGGVTVTKQAVEAATSVSSSFASGPADGLVGLAFSTINTVKPKQATTFFERAQNTLPSKLFTATLKHQAPGSYDFGYLDSSKYTGAISYTPITHASGRAGFWEFVATGYAVGSGSVVSSSLDAIADTGTTLLYMPSAVVKAYYAQVPKSSNSAVVGGYVFPCSSTLPPLGIQVGGATHYIPGSYLNFAPAYSLFGTQYCFGGLQLNTGLPFSIFGDIFLKATYAVFDAGNNRMGFATQAGLPSS